MMKRSVILAAAIAAAAALAIFAQGEDAMAPDVVAGKLIYEETAGDVGCASCHGIDATGDFGPAILGASAELISAQFEVNEAMMFIEMTDEEVAQVAAYLAYLASQ